MLYWLAIKNTQKITGFLPQDKEVTFDAWPGCMGEQRRALCVATSLKAREKELTQNCDKKTRFLSGFSCESVLQCALKFLRLWRNWYTRRIQIPMRSNSCRFKSCQPQSYSHGLSEQSVSPYFCHFWQNCRLSITLSITLKFAYQLALSISNFALSVSAILDFASMSKLT